MKMFFVLCALLLALSNSSQGQSKANTNKTNDNSAFADSIQRITFTMPSYKKKQKLFIALTIPLVTFSILSNNNDHKTAPLAFAATGIVTASLGLYYTIKIDNLFKKAHAR